MGTVQCYLALLLPSSDVSYSVLMQHAHTFRLSMEELFLMHTHLGLYRFSIESLFPYLPLELPLQVGSSHFRMSYCALLIKTVAHRVLVRLQENKELVRNHEIVG